MKRNLLIAAAGLFFTCLQSAAADNSIRWNGYLNIIGGKLRDEPRIDQSTEDQYPGYRTYTNDLGFDPETSGALQVTKDLDDKLQVTAQLFGEGNSDYDVKMKWLYVRYKPEENSMFRVGKIIAPFYYFSDFLNYGMAYPWITPPTEVYQYSFSLRGLDYVYRGILNDSVEWSAEVFGGTFDDYFPDISANISAKETLGFVLTGSKDWLTVRGVVVNQKSTSMLDGFNTEQIFDQAILTPTQEMFSLSAAQTAQLRAETLPALQERFDLEEVDVTYYGIFSKVDIADWLLLAEWTRTKPDSYLLHTFENWYLTVGYRLENAMIHLTYAEFEAGYSSQAKADSVAQPGGPSPNDWANFLVTQVAAGVASTFTSDHQTTTLGLRLDTTPNTALKFEISYIEEKSNVPGKTAGIGENLLYRTALNVAF